MSQPWRRGSSLSQLSAGKRPQSIWANPTSSNNPPPTRTGQGISRDGLRMARKDLGGKREQDEFNMLLSPSRGIADDDPTSLKNPAIQERFRDHIAEKLKKWSQTFPFGVRDHDSKRRDEELGIILLDLRKLREGIHSIRRIDAFACEVYETSVLLSIVASNQAQLLSSLPHLVTVMHPALAQNGLSTSLASLSISSGATPAQSIPSPETRSFYLALHLLHSHLLPAFAAPSAPTSIAATPSHPPVSTFHTTLFSFLALSSLPRPDSATSRSSLREPFVPFLLAVHSAFIRSSYATISTLLSQIPQPPSSVKTRIASLLSIESTGSSATSRLSTSAPNPFALLLRGAVPQLRESCYKSIIERSYRCPPDPSDWLSKWLLFEFEVRLELELGLLQLEDDGKVSTRQREEVAENWDGKESDDEDNQPIGAEKSYLIREAQRRAAEYVKLKKGF